MNLPQCSPQTADNDDDDGRESVTSNQCDIRIAVDDEDDLVSTVSQSRASATSGDGVNGERALIKNRQDATLSRAFMTFVRGHNDGASLPSFTLIPFDTPLPASPRETARLSLMVAGCVDSENSRVAWHEISSATTLLPGVMADFGELCQCYFCPRHSSLATPIVHLKHVCTFDGGDQRVHLSVRPACTPCAKKRTAAVRDKPLITVSRVFLQERLTAHLTYVMARMSALFDSIRIQQDDAAVACDACYAPMTHDADILVVVAQRRDKSELAVFPVCSETCRASLQANLRSVTDESLACPRAAHPTYKLSGKLSVLPLGATNPRRKNPPPPPRESAAPASGDLPDLHDVPVAQWEVISDEDFRSMASKGPDALANGRAGKGTLIHHCRQRGCFCRATHRGQFRNNMMMQLHKKQQDSSPVGNHYVLEKIYNQLRSIHLYTDILGSNDQTRCLACQKPTASFCTECLAVRACPNDECRRKSHAAHAALCRPYKDAWSALAVA